jgi:glycine betaine/proline transport system substrate-binding protein
MWNNRGHLGQTGPIKGVLLMRRSRSALVALSVAAVLGVSACSSDKPKDTAPAATEASTDSVAAVSAGDKATIKLVENAWTASAINVEIAKQLIEKNLGNKVEIVKIDENLQFAGLASGDLDATLEIWPSGVVAEEQKYIDDGQIVNAGPLGAVGKIGWFVPDYVEEKFPSLKTWEGFKDPAVAKAFATAETGDKGRFLGTDPSYSQYDETIVKNLGLPLQVQFSGSEAATVAELDSRVAAKEPVVMYWWTPTAAVAKYKLKNIALPAYSKDCYADPAKIACDYPEDVLFKAESAKLEAKAPAVAAFIKKFTLSTEDQLAMLPTVEIDKKPVADVAAAWIAANESTWKAWLA